MLKELEEKLFKLVKENLKTTESETIIKIITKYEELERENKYLRGEQESCIKEIKDYKKETDETIKKITEEKESAEKHAIELEEKIIKVKDLKLIEAKLNIRAEMMDKSYKDYHNLLKIIFKTPNKISEFDTPVVRTSYMTEYNNNGNPVTKPTGDYVENAKTTTTEKTDYEQE